jgi:hypothetical protein
MGLRKGLDEKELAWSHFSQKAQRGFTAIPFKHSGGPSAVDGLRFQVADFRTQLQLKKNGTTCRGSGQETAMDAQPLYSSASHAHP